MADKYTLECEVCGSNFQYGAHRYEGRHLARYDITVCSRCYDGNRDGWAPRYEERLLKSLRRSGKTPPPRLPNGLLPRE